MLAARRRFLHLTPLVIPISALDPCVYVLPPPQPACLPPER